MNSSTGRLTERVYYLACSLYYGAIFLRSLIIFKDSPILSQVLGLQLLWLVLFLSEPAISRRWSGYFPIYLLFQTALVFILLSRPGFTDFFASLLPLLGMQVMLRLKPIIGGVWIGLCAILMFLLLRETYGTVPTIALALIYTAGNVFFSTYSLATRRAQTVGMKNQELAHELQETNHQLETYSSQLAELGVTRERNRLARELHDSVTQTVFSITLSTQSALLLLDRDPTQVGSHLERLNQLARSALAEMQVLISELKPDKSAKEGLVSLLHRHLAGSRLPENLTVSLEVEGDQRLEFAEEQGLFHIAEEALNNIVKHAQTAQAEIRLHLADPFWMAIEDHGQGFDLSQAEHSGRVGLSSMRERAEEIGWDLQVITSPGAGTCIQVEKAPIREEQA